MAGSIYNWSTTPSNNDTADPDINWAEYQAPDTVNNSARQMMARFKAWLGDISTSKATTGAANSYVVSSVSQPGGASPPDGMVIGFLPHQTNSGPCTLNVDSYGGIPLRAVSGSGLTSGAIQAATPMVAQYRAASNEWLVQNTGGNFGAYLSAYQSIDLTARLLPVGAMFPWFGSTAPAGYLLAYGQAVSRTTYAELFAAFGTTYGAGDGSTTFNLPDLRGRSLFGKDDMGGSAANRVTNAVSGITGTQLGDAGGAQSVTIAKTNLPNITLTGGTTDTVTLTGYVNYISQTFYASGEAGGVFSKKPAGATYPDPNTPVTVDISNTGGFEFDGSHNHSVTIPLGGSGAAVNKMPPAIICNWIILALPAAAKAAALSKGSLTLANGLNSNVTLPSQESLRISGPSAAFSVGGLTAGGNGQCVRLYNTTSQAMTLVNEDVSSTAANRIKTLTGANVTLRTGTSYASLEYDTTDNRWLLVSTN